MLPDDWEIDQGLNPNDSSDPLTDSDDDGLTNPQERYYGLLALNADTDNDRFSDGEEIVNGTNPLDIEHFPLSIASSPIMEHPVGNTYSYFLSANQVNVTYE